MAGRLGQPEALYDASALDALLSAAQGAAQATGPDRSAADPRQLLGPLLDRTAFIVEPTARRAVTRDWLSELDVESLQQLLSLLKPNPVWAESYEPRAAS